MDLVAGPDVGLSGDSEAGLPVGFPPSWLAAAGRPAFRDLAALAVALLPATSRIRLAGPVGAAPVLPLLRPPVPRPLVPGLPALGLPAFALPLPVLPAPLPFRCGGLVSLIVVSPASLRSALISSIVNGRACPSSRSPKVRGPIDQRSRRKVGIANPGRHVANLPLLARFRAAPRAAIRPHWVPC